MSKIGIIPAECLGGTSGEAIYIDTEGSFMAVRAAQMAQHLSLHLQRIAKSSKSSDPGAVIRAAQQISQEYLLQHIHVFRVFDQTELIALLNQLPAQFDSNPRVKVLIIDSIAYLFRQDVQEIGARNRVLSSIVQMLNDYALLYKVAVVVTNHVTTKIDIDEQGSKVGRVVPALGDHWAHCITNRVILEMDSDGNRIATLSKSLSRPYESIMYSVNEVGIRDSVTIQLRALLK